MSDSSCTRQRARSSTVSESLFPIRSHGEYYLKVPLRVFVESTSRVSPTHYPRWHPCKSTQPAKSKSQPANTKVSRQSSDKRAMLTTLLVYCPSNTDALRTQHWRRVWMPPSSPNCLVYMCGVVCVIQNNPRPLLQLLCVPKYKSTRNLYELYKESVGREWNEHMLMHIPRPPRGSSTPHLRVHYYR
jgi:hypothetical protein